MKIIPLLLIFIIANSCSSTNKEALYFKTFINENNKNNPYFKRFNKDSIKIIRTIENNSGINYYEFESSLTERFNNYISSINIRNDSIFNENVSSMISTINTPVHGRIYTQVYASLNRQLLLTFADTINSFRTFFDAHSFFQGEQKDNHNKQLYFGTCKLIKKEIDNKNKDIIFTVRINSIFNHGVTDSEESWASLYIREETYSVKRGLLKYSVIWLESNTEIVSFTRI